MKSILLTLKPEQVVNVLNEKQTIIVRKKFPKDYVGWVYIYCTKVKTPHRKNIFLNENNKYGRSIEVATEWGTEKDEITVNSGWFPYKSFKANGKVVARFWCDKVEEIKLEPVEDYSSNTYEYMTKTLEESDLLEKSCLHTLYLSKYLQGKKGYAIHISKLEVFDKPRALWEFVLYDKNHLSIGNCVIGFGNGSCKRLTNAPQNYCFIEGEE